MTTKEARQIVREFDSDTMNPTEEEFFLFTEARDFLIHKEHDPRDMMYLGGVYQWFRSCGDFFMDAVIDDSNIKLTPVADELYGFTLGS